MKKTGPYHMRAVVRDATSQKLGSAMQFVEIPDLKNGRLALSGIVMTAAQSSAGTNTQEDIDGTPAVRIFKAGSAIYYAYEIMNARADGGARSQLETQIRIYRDGQAIYALPESPLNIDGQQNSKRYVVGGRMELKKIPPGTYVMQIIVSDTLRKDKSGIAAQALDFEVQD